jgi:hypothetical protein
MDCTGCDHRLVRDRLQALPWSTKRCTSAPSTGDLRDMTDMRCIYITQYAVYALGLHYYPPSGRQCSVGFRRKSSARFSSPLLQISHQPVERLLVRVVVLSRPKVADDVILRVVALPRAEFDP